MPIFSKQSASAPTEPSELIPRSSGDPIGYSPLNGQVGIINYHFRDPDTLYGPFVLPMYDGAYALEIAKRISGESGQWEGDYNVFTYKDMEEKPDHLYGTGQLRLRRMGENGAYWVIWLLEPTEVVMNQLGYVPGTRMHFIGVGMEAQDGSHLVGGWSNSTYSRIYPVDPKAGTDAYREFGFHGAPGPVDG